MGNSYLRMVNSNLQTDKGPQKEVKRERQKAREMSAETKERSSDLYFDVVPFGR